MSSVRSEALADLIADATAGPTTAVSKVQSCSGGCIHRAEIVHLADGRKYFVKSSRNASDMFAQEALGLAALAESKTLRTPRVIAAGMLGGESCLVLEAIEAGSQRSDFWKTFGSQFAELHRVSTAERFGWSTENYLGSNVQSNEAKEDWVEFFAECRFGYQLRLARNRGLGSRELFKIMDRLVSRLDGYLSCPKDPPSLLHGDLWSGNYLVDQDGHPVLIDPAVYYGRREADLAMPLLFGGFSPDFFDAYGEAWPLTDGWRDRVELYKLYHLLNHLNLFGSGYLDSCLEIARRFA